MLSRIHRVPKNLFPLLKKNTLYEGEVFSLRVTRVQETLAVENIKCVCIVSKKVSKKAVDRNKVKRRVYSIINKYLKSCDKKIVVQIFPKKIAITTDFEKQKKELLELFNNIK